MEIEINAVPSGVEPRNCILHDKPVRWLLSLGNVEMSLCEDCIEKVKERLETVLGKEGQKKDAEKILTDKIRDAFPGYPISIVGPDEKHRVVRVYGILDHRKEDAKSAVCTIINSLERDGMIPKGKYIPNIISHSETAFYPNPWDRRFFEEGV